MILILTYVIIIKGERKKKVIDKFSATFEHSIYEGKELIEIAFPFLFTFLNEKWKQQTDRFSRE